MAISKGDLLMGLGAAVTGRAPQFVEGLQQREQQTTERKRAELQARQQAMYQDAYSAFQMLSNGDLDGIIQLGTDRLDVLKTFPDADPSDTVRIVQNATNAKAGDPIALRNLALELTGAAERGVAMGIIQPPKAEEYTLSPGEARFRGGKRIAMVPEKEEPGFEIIPLAEVSAIPGLDPTKPYQRNLRTNQISQVGGGGTTVNVGQASESERTAGILANRLDFAQSQISDMLQSAPEAERPAAGATVLNAVGLDYLARVANPTERQIIEAAQMDMLDAALTLGTGAAYTKEQLEGYRASFFPQMGDDPDTISSKAQRLNNLVNAAYEKAGRAAPTVRRGVQTQPPSDWVNAGLTQQDWDALSEEEKQVFMEPK